MANIWHIFAFLKRRLRVALLRTFLAVFAYIPLRRDRLLSVQKYNASVQSIWIPSSDDKSRTRKIKAHLYSPPPTPSSSSTPKPVLVNWHGSGYILPMHGSDSLFCAQVAKEAGIFVLDADYRKAPENPFPAALDDVIDVLNWIATQPERFDISRVAVSGASAGATLALVASSSLRKTFKATLEVVIALYPPTNLTLQGENRVVPRPIRPIPPHMIQLFTESYVPEKVKRKDPKVSPSFANPEDFPSTVVMITCEGDILAPEAEALAEKLDDGSRKVITCRLEGVAHGFDKGAQQGTKEWERREDAYALVVETLKESFNL